MYRKTTFGVFLVLPVLLVWPASPGFTKAKKDKNIGPVEIQIQHVRPRKNPSKKDFIRVAFTAKRVDSGKRVKDGIFCSLDGQSDKECKSPVVYKGLASGQHRLQIRSEEPGSEPASYSWTVDKTPPVLDWVRVPLDLSDSDSATFEFQSEENSKFECRLDNGKFKACSSPATVKVAEGIHHFYVRATDKLGNRSDAISYLWRVDTTGPEFRSVQFYPGEGVTTSNSAFVSFNLSEMGSVECEMNGDPWGECFSPLEMSALSDGEQELILTPFDVLGNAGEPMVFRWTVDSTQSNINLSVIDPREFPTSNRKAKFEINKVGKRDLECHLDGMTVEHCKNPVNLVNLSEGMHTFTAQAVAEDPVSFSWIIDQTEPVLSIQGLERAPAGVVDNYLLLFIDTSEPVKLFYGLDGGAGIPTSSPILLNDLSSGQHEIRIWAQDDAGNNSSDLRHLWTSSGN